MTQIFLRAAPFLSNVVNLTSMSDTKVSELSTSNTFVYLE